MTGMIRILHVVPLGGIGGAERFVHSLCRHHDRNRFTVSVCVLFPFTGYAVADEIAALGHDVMKLDMSSGFDLLKASRLVAYIRKQNIDIVHIHGQNPLGKLCSLLGSAPVVVHTDHGTTIGSPVRRRRRVVLFNRLLTPYIDGFIAISRGMEKSLRVRERVPEGKITLIYNGIDVDSLSGASGNKEALKRLLGIPLRTPILGTVGRLVPEKQYPLLLEAFSLLRRAGVAFVALVAGEGPQRDYLEGLIKRMDLSDNVRLLGERSDIDQLLDSTDVFVFSSGGEAFSITILEAMAKAKPIVAFDVEGVNEAVVNEKTGFLVPFRDVGAFAERTKLLLQSPELAQRMGRAAFEKVRAEFDIKENVRRTEALYLGLLRNGCERPAAAPV